MHELDWDENGTPVSRVFGDPYFSRTDGRAETRHVFLAGNGLPDRWQNRNHFTIAELGFGTGLNFLETAAAWRQCRPPDATLSYVAFERYPLSSSDLARALAPWPDLAADAAVLTGLWPPPPGWSEHEVAAVHLHIYIGDANTGLPQWNGLADAWYLDGFSPAKNPDLWGHDLMRHVYTNTAPGGTLATFTVAGWVRRNLGAAGFEVTKIPGYGRKRECLKGARSCGQDSTARPQL